MKLYTEQTGFSPAEIEFLSENTEIDVIPTERMADVQLISVRPFLFIERLQKLTQWTGTLWPVSTSSEN